jgi:hypothetical protein
MLAWAAGFFDGEGYVTIQKRNSEVNGKRYRGFYLRVGLKHVAPAPIYELQKLFGGTVRIEQRRTSKDGCSRKDIHVWQVSCEEAKSCLVQMMPYFINKTKVAELGIELQNTMQSNKKAVSAEINSLRESIKEEISRLNSLD